MAKKQPNIRDRVIEMRRVPSSEIADNPGNWRKHPKNQQSALLGMLGEVGIAGALVAYHSERNGGALTLIDGHLRRDSAEVDWPVLVLDVTDAEADLLLATIDPLSAMATTDAGKLDELLREVSTGEAAVQEMLAKLAEASGVIPPDPKAAAEDPGAQVDKADELRQKWQTERGQLWEIGRHRLLCGDSTSAEDVARLMGGERADCMWTDPPYGVSYVGKTKDALTIQNDGAGDLEGLLTRAFSAATQALVAGAPFYIAAPAGPQGTVFRVVIGAVGWKFHQALVWVKDAMVLGHSDYHYRHEDILYGWIPGPGRSGRGDHVGSKWLGDNSQTTVFEVPRPKRSEEHPTMKPPELVAAMIRNSCPPGGVLYEPFSGSGTTLVAAEQTGRACYAMEIEPKYVAVALERLAGMGLDPRLVS